MCSVFPGTPAASNVQLQWSKFLPLVSEQGFQRFYDSDRTKDCGKVRFSDQVESLKRELYGDDDDVDYPKFAFLAIEKLMTSSRQDLVGINMTNSDLIGCGTFGTIIGYDGDDGDELKVSKIGRNYFLLKELSILTHLKSQEPSTAGGGDNVIKLVDCGVKEMDFGGTKIRMPCLRLSPRGVTPYNLTSKYLRKRRK